MSQISTMEAHTDDRFPGVKMFMMRKANPQRLIVVVPPQGIIKAHKHPVNARMRVVFGSACVVSSDPAIHGTQVGPGKIVFFEKEIAHGFDNVGQDGFIFESESDDEGIIQDGEVQAQFA